MSSPEKDVKQILPGELRVLWPWRRSGV